MIEAAIFGDGLHVLLRDAQDTRRSARVAAGTEHHRHRAAADRAEPRGRVRAAGRAPPGGVMNLRRLLAIAYKETLQVWRDPRSLAIALLMPAMQMVLLGYGVSLDIRHVPLCVYDQEQSQISRELVADFSAGGWFDVVANLPDERALRAAMDRGALHRRAGDSRGFHPRI